MANEPQEAVRTSTVVERWVRPVEGGYECQAFLFAWDSGAWIVTEGNPDFWSGFYGLVLQYGWPDRIEVSPSYERVTYR